MDGTDLMTRSAGPSSSSRASVSSPRLLLRARLPAVASATPSTSAATVGVDPASAQRTLPRSRGSNAHRGVGPGRALSRPALRELGVDGFGADRALPRRGLSRIRKPRSSERRRRRKGWPSRFSDAGRASGPRSAVRRRGGASGRSPSAPSVIDRSTAIVGRLRRSCGDDDCLATCRAGAVFVFSHSSFAVGPKAES